MKIRQLIRIMLILIVTGWALGCLRFGPDADTAKPTAEQVTHCRELLGIDPGLEITPVGYKAVYGIDDAVWFKFSCKTGSPSPIIRRPDNTPYLHGEGIGNLANGGGSVWWDVTEKEVTWSESWTDPDGRWCLSWTAVPEGNTTLVYVFWNEM